MITALITIPFTCPIVCLLKLIYLLPVCVFFYFAESRSSPDVTRLLNNLFDPERQQKDAFTTIPVENSSEMIHVQAGIYIIKLIQLVNKIYLLITLFDGEAYFRTYSSVDQLSIYENICNWAAD